MQGARPLDHRPPWRSAKNARYFKTWRHRRPKQIRTGTVPRRTKDALSPRVGLLARGFRKLLKIQRSPNLPRRYKRYNRRVDLWRNSPQYSGGTAPAFHRTSLLRPCGHPKSLRHVPLWRCDVKRYSPNPPRAPRSFFKVPVRFATQSSILTDYNGLTMPWAGS
jgi:hypothetical protein